MSGDSAPLGRTLRLASPVAERVVLTTLLGTLAALAGIGLLTTSAWILARASQHPSIVALGVAVVGVRFFAITRAICRYFERLVGHDAALRVQATRRVEIYEKLERLAPSGHSSFHRGDLLARTVDDIDALQDVMLRVIPPIGIALMAGIVSTAFIALILPPAALILLTALSAAVLIVPLITYRIADRSEHTEGLARGIMHTSAVDLVDGLAELIANGATTSHLDAVTTADNSLTRRASSNAFTAGIGTATLTLLSGAAVLGALIFGIDAIDAGRVQAVFLPVVALAPLAVFETVSTLPESGLALRRVRQSAARVFAVLDKPVPVVEPSNPLMRPHCPHTISIRDLQVRYSDTASWALDGLTLDIPPGRHVGIVGRSGAGKSTLALALTRLVSYQGGSITLDRMPLDAFDGDDVRRVIGLCAQNAYIFNTSVRENLLVAHRDATDAELLNVLRRVRLSDWLTELPDGLDTPMGTDGDRVSGGQRQRLAVARALLADFDVLILDEPCEHLDIATASALTADLLRATRGRTVILITHQLIATEGLNDLIVMDSGRIVHQAQHHETAVQTTTLVR